MKAKVRFNSWMKKCAFVVILKIFIVNCLCKHHTQNGKRCFAAKKKSIDNCPKKKVVIDEKCQYLNRLPKWEIYVCLVVIRHFFPIETHFGAASTLCNGKIIWWSTCLNHMHRPLSSGFFLYLSLFHFFSIYKLQA